MDQKQHSSSNEDRGYEFGFRVPSISLLDSQQWNYIRKWYRITARELQVARLVCRGLNNNKIAAELRISHGTVKTHIRNIYRRIRVKNKIQMLLRFVQVANNLSAKSQTTSNIPIIELKQSDTDKKTSFPSSIPQKE